MRGLGRGWVRTDRGLDFTDRGLDFQGDRVREGFCAVSGAVLHVALEELALFENEGRILSGAHGDVEDGHSLDADKSGLIVFCLLNYTGDVAAKDSC
jgi:hypothetical protein